MEIHEMTEEQLVALRKADPGVFLRMRNDNLAMGIRSVIQVLEMIARSLDPDAEDIYTYWDDIVAANMLGQQSQFLAIMQNQFAFQYEQSRALARGAEVDEGTLAEFSQELARLQGPPPDLGAPGHPDVRGNGGDCGPSTEGG